MTVRAVTYYLVDCDADGCKTTTGDLGDYSAWGDPGDALDQWMDHYGTHDETTGATF